MTLPYPIADLATRFGRIVMEGEVPELVPLIVLEGGPEHGWVYDSRGMATEPPKSVDGVEFGAVTYSYDAGGGLVLDLLDGRLARLFAYVGHQVQVEER